MNEHITPEKFDELKTLAKPLQDWMMDNFDMMHRVEITSDFITVLTPTIGTPMAAKGL